MDIKFKVSDENGSFHGTFSNPEDAREHAQEMANELDKDMFIERITSEIIECVIAD